MEEAVVNFFRKNKRSSERFRDKERFLRVLLLFLIIGAAVFMVWGGLWDGYAMEPHYGTRAYKEPFWTYQQGSEVLETGLTTPAFRKMETGKTYSISRILTFDGSHERDPNCFFFVDHMFSRVLLNGEELFRYMPEDIQKRENSRSPGNVYAAVPLPRNCMGQRLTIEFIPALSDSIEYQLPNPCFGGFAARIMFLFRQELAQNIVGLAAAFLGVTAILFSTLVLSGSHYREGMFIGAFAVLFSMYNLTESDFDFYVISNPCYTYVLDYITFTLMPLFLIAYLRERLKARRKQVTTLILCGDLAMFLAEMVLHFTGLVDMREFLPILHVVYGGEFFILFLFFATMKGVGQRNHLAFQMVPILLGTILDSSVYYLHWDLGSSDSTFTAIGVLLFLVTEMESVWKYSVEVYAESMKSQEYQLMAYLDALTGIGNRRAFDAERDVIAAGRREYGTLFVASVDLNDLKLTNDTMGHAAGDFLIRSAADVLSDLTEDCGHAFRIGGDEFALLVYDISEREWNSRLDAMKKQIHSINEKSEVKLSLSLGYEPVRSRNISAAMETADQKMYAEKHKYKQSRRA